MKTASVALLTVLLVTATVGAAPATDGLAGDTGNTVTSAPTPIDSCTTITEPGRYVLTSDITDARANQDTGYVRNTDGQKREACLFVNATDVVIDGDGHTVDGVHSPQYTAGVFVTAPVAPSNVTVRNLTASEWDTGFHYSDVTHISLERTTSRNNSNYGAYLTRTSRAVIREVNASNDSDIGITLWNTSEIQVQKVTANETYTGIEISNSSNVTLSQITAVDNEASGIAFFDVAGATLTEGTITRNGITGVYLQGSSGIQVSNVEASTGAFGDITLFNSTDNRFEEVTATGNGNWAFYSDSQSPNNVATNFSFANVTLSFTATNVALTSADMPPDVPEGYRDIGIAINGTATGEPSRLDLRLRYLGEEFRTTELEERSLRLWRFEGGEWSKTTGDNYIQTAQNTLIANVTDLNATLVPLAEPAPGAETEPTTVPPEPTAEPTSEPTTELTVESAAEPSSELETQLTAEPTSTSEPTTEISPETTPVSEPTTLPDDGTTPPTDESGASPFENPLVVQTADGTVDVGPPRDLDGDGLYEDVNGDGVVSDGDFQALFLIFSATQRGELELTPAQTAALDFDQDGEFDQSDLFAFRRGL